MERRDVQVPGGPRLSCLVGGDPGAPAMVLLHALGENATSWDAVAERLVPHYSVLAPDLRGHGESDRPGEYSSELMRDDVLGLLDALGLAEVVLLGHSMGGVVAYLVAQEQPARVTRLVIEDVVPPFPLERTVPDRPDVPVPFDGPSRRRSSPRRTTRPAGTGSVCRRSPRRPCSSVAGRRAMSPPRNSRRWPG